MRIQRYETDRALLLSWNSLPIERHTKTRLWYYERHGEQAWQRIMVVGTEMRPHRGRIVREGLSVTFKLILKAEVEPTVKRGENLLSRGNYVQRA